MPRSLQSHSASLDELIARWIRRGIAYRDVSARVDGGSLCDQFARDLRALDMQDRGQLLTLHEAARESGYTEQHLRRLIHTGALPFIGAGRNRRIRARDLPRKPSRVARETPLCEFAHATAEQAVRNSVGASTGNPR